jgi:hypothetical protein
VLRSSIVAALGALAGLVLALLLFWSGPWIVGWVKGPPRLEVEAWVFYITTICGAGFGAVTGALIGVVEALRDAVRSHSG